LGDDAVSIATGSIVVIGGNFGGGDVGEGIHLSMLWCRTSSGENEIAKVMPLFIPSTPYADAQVTTEREVCEDNSRLN
jgi:hypothetical protein